MTGQSMGLIDPAENLLDTNPSGRILVIEDRPGNGGLVHRRADAAA